MSTATSTRTRDDWQWLLTFFSPADLADLTGPLTGEQAARVDGILAAVARGVPGHVAVTAFTNGNSSAVDDRPIAQEHDR
jgi:hypothetical protein